MNRTYKGEIVDTCLLLISDNIDFVAGCRHLVSLRNDFNLENDLEFLPFIGVVSETDDYPEYNIRKNFSKDYLTKIDKEISGYISQVRPEILEACRMLIAKYE